MGYVIICKEFKRADVVKLVYTLASGASDLKQVVGVRISPSAHYVTYNRDTREAREDVTS